MASMSTNARLASPSACARAPRLREASFDDYPQVASLQAERGLRVRSCEEWRHLWEENPAYLDMGGQWPMGWVLETGDKIVGYVGNIPTRYELDGRRLTAGCGYSWVVTPAYSAYSILLLHEYLAQKSAALCVSTTAGTTSYKAHTALGAMPAPGGAWDRSSVWITSYTGFVSSWLQRKKWPMPDVLSYPISAALYTRDAIRAGAPRKKNGGVRDVEIEYVEQFDERFEAFWQQLRAQNPGRLLAERSPRVLSWHFRDALRQKKLWIATAKTATCLCAYAIFEQLPNAAHEPQQVALIDFQTTAEDRSLFYPLLESALKRCSREGIHLLKTIGLCPEGIGDVSALAPYAVRQEGRPLYKALDATLAARLKDPSVWTPSLFDGDASL